MVASVKRQSPRGKRASAESTIPPATFTGTKKIVLAGNPNVGKSAIFNALTGLSADVSNYPGTTIDVSRGRLGIHELIDTPGIYGVSSFNDEEKIARKIILQGELIINVASALSLDRDLFLTLQLMAFGQPMLLILNQWDEAVARGLDIDKALLSELLGIPVIHTIAVNGHGIEEITGQIPNARVGNVDQSLLSRLRQFTDAGISPAIALLALEGDELSAQQLSVSCGNYQSEIYRTRRQQVNELYERVVTHRPSRQALSVKVGRMLLHPVYGTLMSMAVCYLIFYQLLGVFVAGTVVDFTEKKCMRPYYEPTVRRLAAAVFPATISVGNRTFDFPTGTAFGTSEQTRQQLNAALASQDPLSVKYDFWSYKNIWSLAGNALVGEYGVLTLTATYLIGLLMPLVMGFYLGLSLLEDSGYLPRLAVLVDRLLNKIGLNGRAIIPLILGLGCVTMATVTTRLLTTTREKIIATVLLGVAIPCSAQLGIVSGTLAKSGGLLSWAVYGGVIGGMLAATGLLLHKLMPGKSQPLMIDLPPMRLPRAKNVLKKTWSKSWNFMQESMPMFALAGLVVTVGQVTGALDWFIHILQPITVSWLRLPNDPRIATTFILGIVRRDFAAFGLTDVALSPVQAVISMIVITLFVPCVATVGVMIKERGFKIAMTIWIGSWLCAFAFGGILARVLPPIFQLCH